MIDGTDVVGRRWRPALWATGTVLLSGALVLGAMIVRQSSALEANLEVTGDIVGANVRTMSQVQRELLRLDAAVAGPDVDPELVDELQAFVNQRMVEATLDHQLQTLGSATLLEQARTLVARWQDEVAPAVDALVDDPAAVDAVARADLRDELEQLELGFNSIVAEGEINRRHLAGAANQSILGLLAWTRAGLIGLITTLVGFVAFIGAAVVGLARADRQRAGVTARLLEADTEMRKLSAVARSTDNMVVITDAEGRIEWVNDAFERATGHPLHEVLGQRPGHLLQGPATDPTTVAEMAAATAAGEPFAVEVLNYTRAGEPYWVAIESQPVRDEQGRVRTFIAIERDITERRRAEEQLRRAKEAAEETAREKANFLATMSHEIRTPLNGVIGLCTLLLDGELEAAQRAHVETARRSGSLLLEIVNDILNFSSIESGGVELEARTFDVDELVASTLEMFRQDATSRGIRLEARVDGPAEGPHLRVGDDTRVRQMLVNLVANAVKFTERGGVEVVVAAPDGRDLVLEVRDTGIGIPADRRERLFQPFTQVDASTTRRYGGTGLGLAICHRLATAMGGAIEVDSVPGVGSVFRLVLPLPTTASPAVTDRGDLPVWVRGLRVVVAEDDPVNQIVATHLLGQLGHEATVVEDGEAAVAAVVRGDVDVVLMDVHMPGMDGVTATRLIHERLGEARPRIVALTANAMVGDRERLLAAGMDGYVSKPVELDALGRVLTEVTTPTIPTSPEVPCSPRP